MSTGRIVPFGDLTPREFVEGAAKIGLQKERISKSQRSSFRGGLNTGGHFLSFGLINGERSQLSYKDRL
jgi:hypothetical protein